jgi:hypothetical protein
MGIFVFRGFEIHGFKIGHTYGILRNETAPSARPTL